MRTSGWRCVLDQRRDLGCHGFPGARAQVIGEWNDERRKRLDLRTPESKALGDFARVVRVEDQQILQLRRIPLRDPGPCAHERWHVRLLERLRDPADRLCTGAIVAVNVGTLVLVTTFVPFTTQLGLQFWFLEGLLCGAMGGRLPPDA